MIMVKKSEPEVAKRLFENTQREVFTCAEAADLLRTTLSNVRVMVHRKQLPFVKIGRRVLILRDDIEALLLSKRIGANHVS